VPVLYFLLKGREAKNPKSARALQYSDRVL
jgi:hypothetical protein